MYNSLNMDKKIIVKIRKIAYSKLRKLDIYRFYNDVIDIISDYDTNAMHIGDSCDVLIAMQPKAKLLKITADEFAATITNQMRTYEMANLEGNLHLVKLSKSRVYDYLNYLRQKDKVTIDESIRGFSIG